MERSSDKNSNHQQSTNPMIYIKEHNALFNSPEVKEPHPLDTNDCLRTVADFEDYSAMIAAYQQWLSSKAEIIGDHSFVEGIDYQENVHYRIEYQIAKVGSNDFKTVHYGEYKNPMFTNKRIVALPIKEDKENQKQLLSEIMQDDEKSGLYDVPSVQPKDDASLASHSFASGNSIEQLVSFIKELKREALDGYVKNTDIELKTMYSAENMICGMILSKIESLKQ
jgi:hypothetical protein